MSLEAPIFYKIEPGQYSVKSFVKVLDEPRGGHRLRNSLRNFFRQILPTKRARRIG